MLSLVSLPGMKLLCVGATNLGSSGLSRLTSTLEILFRGTLHQLIGRKWLMSFWAFHLRDKRYECAVSI